MTAWTDSHCHVPFEGVDVGVIEDARTAGVTRLVTIGTDASSSAAVVAVAASHPGVWASVGLHPHDAIDGLDGVEAVLGAAPDPNVVAIGECGLDYHYDHSPRPVQRQAFAAQIALAHRFDLALVVHTREAWDDTWDILAAAGVPERTVIHCFTGGPDEATRALSLGAWLSFSGVVTFKNAPEVRQAATLCPLERLLVETDSPFLTPVPHRGTPNRPALVPLVGAAVAEVKGLPVEAVAEATWAGATTVFRLPDGPPAPWAPGEVPGSGVGGASGGGGASGPDGRGGVSGPGGGGGVPGSYGGRR